MKNKLKYENTSDSLLQSASITRQDVFPGYTRSTESPVKGLCCSCLGGITIHYTNSEEKNELVRTALFLKCIKPKP